MKLEQHIQLQHNIKYSKCKFTFKDENRLENHISLAHESNQHINLDLYARIPTFLFGIVF